MGVLLEARDLTVSYFIGKTVLPAVEGLNLDVNEGEILAVVGESGSGKSTFAHAILRAPRPPGRITNGSIMFHGEDLLTMSRSDFQKVKWQKISILPQASQNAFSPTMRIRGHFRDTMRAHNVSDGALIEETARRYLTEVLLEPDRVLDAYPHELSGGMKQRTAIALSLVLKPELLILDEPTSALDVVTQQMILDLIKKIHEETNVTVLFITHDMGLVAGFADRTVVSYAGKIAEIGTTDEIVNSATHPYTHSLMNAVPTLYTDADDIHSIPGDPPNLTQHIQGCRFHGRCAYAQSICEEVEPPLLQVSPGHLSACHFAGTLDFRAKDEAR